MTVNSIVSVSMNQEFRSHLTGCFWLRTWGCSHERLDGGGKVCPQHGPGRGWQLATGSSQGASAGSRHMNLSTGLPVPKYDDWFPPELSDPTELPESQKSYCPFWHVPLVRSESLSPVHTQGQENETQPSEVGSAKDLWTYFKTITFSNAGNSFR